MILRPLPRGRPCPDHCRIEIRQFFPDLCNGVGAKGEDLILPVPVGTTVIDVATQEVIGDLVKAGQRLMVAQGGWHGLGNTRFKSSTNRAPRQTTSRVSSPSF